MKINEFLVQSLDGIQLEIMELEIDIGSFAILFGKKKQIQFLKNVNLDLEVQFSMEIMFNYSVQLFKL